MIDFSGPSQLCPLRRALGGFALTTQAPEDLHRQRDHGSVRLFHSQLLTKPALTFLVSYETNEFCTTSFFRGNGKVPKRDWVIIGAFTNTKDAIMFKLFFSTGTIGIGIAVAALIAWSQAVTPLQATTASSSINPTDMMATYKAPLAVEQWDAI
jgi:hypothetical protein